MRELIETFLNQLWAEAGLAETTLAAYRNDLRSLVAFGEKRGIDFRRISPTDIQAFLAALREEDRLAVSSIARRLVAVKLFCRFCHRNGHMEQDVAAHLRSPEGFAGPGVGTEDPAVGGAQVQLAAGRRGRRGVAGRVALTVHFSPDSHRTFSVPRSGARDLSP